MYDCETGLWTDSPHGYGCYSTENWVWPVDAEAIEDLADAKVECKIRTVGGCEDHGSENVRIPVVALVFASDWMLTQGEANVSVGGCPVTKGSPLGVILRNSTGVFVAGSILEIDLPEPEKYKRGSTMGKKITF